MAYTSIQIAPETRKKIARLKDSKRQTYDEILNKLVALVPQGDNEGEYTDYFRTGILSAKYEITRGKTISHEQLKKTMGL